MGIIQSTIGTAKRMFGVREITDNFKFVKNYSEEVITSELHSNKAGRKPITTDAKELESTYAVFKKLCITYLIIAVCSIVYSAYHFAHQHTVAGLISISFCLMCLSFAFRYHFWMFQIRKRELGCTFREWLNSVTGKGA
jgi:hypothetical protein